MIPDRFWAKVNKTGECWLWTGSLARGYGHFKWMGRARAAHVLSYEWHIGDIPAGVKVDHRCRVRACVNPAHLRLVTNKQNTENRRGGNRGSSSRFQGVSFHKGHGKWQARVRHDQRLYHCGYHSTEERAAEAARAKRLELFTHNDLDRTA